MDKALDFVGQELLPGEPVVAVVGSKLLKRGVIVAVTPKKVRVRFFGKYDWSDTHDGFHEKVVDRYNVVVASPLLTGLDPQVAAEWRSLRDRV